jgi:hypothetical protein
MRLLPLFTLLGLTSCGGRTAISGPLDSGGSADDGSDNEGGALVEAGSSHPAPGTSACDGLPQGTCVLCSDGEWHCGSSGTAYASCAAGQNVCNVDGQPCVKCKSDGSGTMGVWCLNPGGDNNIEGSTVGITCSQ